MGKFFSVIIPTLNEEIYLPKILDDLLKQKKQNFDVIIVDSFSDDLTKNVARSYESKLPVHFYQTKLHNVASQRNYGAKKAKGEFLIFFDADNRVHSNFTKNAEKVIETKKGLFFIPYIIPAERTENNMKFVFHILNIIIEFSQVVGKPFSSGGSMIVEKNLFNRIGGFNPHLFHSEDHDIVRKAASWGAKIKFSKQLVVKFSLRRMKREGRLRLLYKYVLMSGSALFQSREKLQEQIVTYEMGGHLYKDPVSKKTYKDDSFKDYMSAIKVFFKNVFEE